MPMSSVLEQLPLPEEVKLALANREGLMAGYLDLAEAFENADWPAVTKCCEAISLEESFAVDCYAQAMLWADDVMAVASE